MPQPQWRELVLEAIRWRRANQPVRAMECLTQSIAITQLSPELDRETGTSLNYLADLYLQEGDFAQAEDTIRQAIQYRLRLPILEPSLIASDYSILAEILGKKGNYQEAVTIGCQALTLFQKEHGVDDPFVRQISQMVKQLRQNLAQEEKKQRMVQSRE